MRKLYKIHASKGGFSLVEILIVVAIIVILAGVVGVGVAGLINTAKNADSAVKDSSANLSQQLHSGEDSLAGYSFGN